MAGFYPVRDLRKGSAEGAMMPVPDASRYRESAIAQG